jgi:hypothetical protein
MNVGGTSLHYWAQSWRLNLPCLLVMVCILAKGSGDCLITRIP